MLARPAALLALFKPPQKPWRTPLGQAVASFLLGRGPPVTTSLPSSGQTGSTPPPPNPHPPPLLFLTAFIPRQRTARPSPPHPRSCSGLGSWERGKRRNAREKEGEEGSPSSSQEGAETGDSPPPRRGVSDRFISRDKVFPRGTLTDLRGRAPSHHLWPRNVSPSHVTPFHRRFRRYSISGNTAAHLRAALNNRAAWRREAVPEERCFSKLSHLSTGFF